MDRILFKIRTLIYLLCLVLNYGSVMKKKKSPCIGICKFEGPELWCLGCGRTRPDCKKWKQLETDEQRAKFLEIFEKRKTFW